MLTIVIQNGKAVVVTNGTKAINQSNNLSKMSFMPGLIMILVVIGLSYIVIKYILPIVCKYIGYLVSQFKKGIKENE